MPENISQHALDTIEREITRTGDSVKDLTRSYQKDLSDLRKLVDEAVAKAGSVSDQTKTNLEAAFSTKFEHLEKTLGEVQTRADKIEVAAKRMALDGSGNPDLQVKEAIDWQRNCMTIKHTLHPDTVISPENADIEGYQNYRKGFEVLCRRSPTGFNQLQLKDMVLGSDPMGGYWCPPTMLAQVQGQIRDISPIRQIATVQSVSTESVEFPIDEGTLDSGWMGETDVPTPTNTPQLGLGSIPTHILWCMPRATQTLLEDAVVNVESWLGDKISVEFAEEEGNRFVLGSGVKSPRGFLTYPAGLGRGKIEQFPSGAATSIAVDIIKAFPFNLKEGYLPGATWLMNRQAVAKVAVLRMDGATGDYLWQGGLQAGVPSQLVGYPLRMAADMPAVAAGALSVGFGDFRKGYMIVDRLGITIMRDPYSAKPFVEFFARRRVGGDVVQFEAIKLMKIGTTL